MRNVLSAVTACVTLILLVSPVLGAKALNKAEAEQLVRGNTAEGVNKWNKKMTWYFDGSGQLRKHDHLGNKGKAAWSISSRGELCYRDKHDQREKCGAIEPRGDGKYDVNIPGGWKWNKGTPGNPYNL